MKTTTRRRFVKGGSAALATALLGGRSQGDDSRRPNAVILLGDDLRADGLAALGNPVAKTPHLDSIVNQGVVFRRAYTMGSMIGAVCLPSRTMLLSGRSLFRTAGEPSGSDPTTFTLPRVMKEAGYATLQAGKFGNSPGKILEEFEERCDPGQATQVADRVIDFIHRQAAKAPLFIYMAGKEPHDPQFAPANFYAQYKPEEMPLPTAFAPYHPFDNGEMTVRDEMTLPFPRTPQDIQGKLARYNASISYLDFEFGRVVQALKDCGEYDHTIFILAGDNGLSLGEHGLLGKQNLYEFGGMHVPLVFAGPGIPKGETRARAYLMDLFPTICELAGIPNPSAVEGLSLVPVIEGSASEVRPWLYTAYGKGQRAVTDGRWKLIRYPLIDKTQLFDLETDPHETKDLSVLPEHAERIRLMLDKLASLQREYADPVPLTAVEVQPSEWSPAKLTPEQLRYQAEETARCKDGLLWESSLSGKR